MTTDNKASSSSVDFGEALVKMFKKVIDEQVKGDMDLLECIKVIGARLDKLDARIDALLDSVATLQEAAIHNLEKEEGTTQH